MMQILLRSQGGGGVSRGGDHAVLLTMTVLVRRSEVRLCIAVFALQPTTRSLYPSSRYTFAVLILSFPLPFTVESIITTAYILRLHITRIATYSFMQCLYIPFAHPSLIIHSLLLFLATNLLNIP